MNKTQQYQCGLFCPELRTCGKALRTSNLVLGLTLGLWFCVIQGAAGTSGTTEPPARAKSVRWSVSLPPLTTTVLERLQRPEVAQTKGRFRIGTSRTFDKPIVVNADTVAEKDWQVSADGSRSVFVEVESQGALGLRLHIERLELPGGSRLLISDAVNSAAPAITVSQADADSQGGIWIPTIFAQQVRVECRVPAAVALKDVAFEITGVSHIYILPTLAPATASEENTKEGSCHLDVTCSSDYAQQASGVARMSFVDNGDTLLCTGCLLATDNNNDSFFLTANHCITDQATASSIELFWLYQTAACKGTPPALTSVPQTSGGADLVASSVANDFSFLRLRQLPPDGTTALDWSTNRPSTTETLACIHHPGGTYKRICFGTLFDSDANFWAVQWSRGVTEPGSSGGPLLNGAHQVIGQLNGGFSGPGSSCGNPSAPDQFGRFDLTYQAIQSWLGGGSGTNPIVTGDSVPPNKGTFNGLFADQGGGVTPQSAGFVTLTTMASGKFSGHLQMSGGRYGFKGQFGSDGTVQTRVPRGAMRPLTLQMQGDAASGGDTIIGTVSDGTWNATLSADRAVFDGRGNVAPQAGRYTLAFQGAAVPNSPIGNSVGVVTVTRAGKIQFVGSLADGTRILQATSVSAAGGWPLFAPLYKGQGLVSGPVTFASSDASDLSGNVSWVKLAALRTKFFKSGFALDSNLTGSSYTPPARGTPVLGSSSATLVLQGDSQTINDPISFGPNNRVTDLNGNRLSLTFSPAYGSFTGKLSSPGNITAATLRGVVLQKQGVGSGYFLTPGQAGELVLQP